METIILDFSEFTLLGSFSIIKNQEVIEAGTFERDKVLELLNYAKVQNVHIIGNCPQNVKEEIIKYNYILV